MAITVDLNCDLGEGIGIEKDIMPYISSCNIACGGHYGTIDSMTETVRLALNHSVKIGAHPSYEDPENFGRKYVGWSESRFRESVTQQIHQIQSVAQQLNAHLHHVKMHGALYHATAHLENESDWLVDLLKSEFTTLKLYAPYGSILSKKAKENSIIVLQEAFADRRYANQHELLSRSHKNAVITNKSEVIEQIKAMVLNHTIMDVNSQKHSIKPDTICVHGDNAIVVDQWSFIHDHLLAHHIKIK